MGYMGFGMKKEVYTRKPKKPYAYLKNLYGEQLKKHLNTSYLTTVEGYNLSDSDLKHFRSKVEERVRQDNRQRLKAGMVSLLMTVAGLFSLVWLVREWFGF